MPFVRIYVDESKSDIETRTLSNTLQQCMESYFEVPAHDQFHLIHKLKDSERVVDSTYLMPEGKQRNRDWVLIEITGGKPRSKEMKARFYRLTADKINQTIGVDPSNIMFVVSTNTMEDWSFSNGEMAPAHPISHSAS